MKPVSASKAISVSEVHGIAGLQYDGLTGSELSRRVSELVREESDYDVALGADADAGGPTLICSLLS
jgi:hypothetical protein